MSHPDSGRLPFEPDARLQGRIDAVMARAIGGQRIVGAVVLVAEKGRLVYRCAAGLADREAAIGMREDAIFRLASITKPLVTAAAMRLVELGFIDLDEPVTRWLPAFCPQRADGSTPVIRLRHLLSHTAGLSYGFLEPPASHFHALGISDGMDDSGLTLAENVARLGRSVLAFTPGRGWRYSLATDVLGAVLERATGETLAAVVQRLVVGPLVMPDTGFAVADVGRLVTPYADGAVAPVRMSDAAAVPFDDGIARFAPGRALDPDAYLSGGAGMVGTAPDVLRFLEAIRGGGAPILHSESVREMMTDQVGTQAETQGPGWGFGFGWAVLGDPALAATPQSAGSIQWGGAYGHSWFVDSARELSVVALTNTAPEGVAGAFPTEIRNAVYG
jgi:CubicO group peptidase (beta-lactamase class C family)